MKILLAGYKFRQAFEHTAEKAKYNCELGAGCLRCCVCCMASMYVFSYVSLLSV